MPGSLLSRHESNRSDDSKKVSFNRAVKVKNFPQKEGEPRRRFWFRPKSEDPSRYHESVLSGSSEDDDRKNLSPILESPLGRPNHVKDMVHMFSQDRQRGGGAHNSPSPPPFRGATTTSRLREEESFQNRSSPGPYRTKIIISDDSNGGSSGDQSPYRQYSPESLEQCVGEFNRVMDHLSSSRKLKRFEDDERRVSSPFEKRKDYADSARYASVYAHTAKDKLDAPNYADTTPKWKAANDYGGGASSKYPTMAYSSRDLADRQHEFTSPKSGFAHKYSDREPLTYKADTKDFHFFNNDVKYSIEEEPLSTLPKSFRFDQDADEYGARSDKVGHKMKNGEHFSHVHEVPIYREDGRLETSLGVRRELHPESHVNGKDPGLPTERKSLSRHFWDSGNRLLSSTHQVRTNKDSTPEGQQFQTSGEESRVWGRRQETVYEEEPWRRRAVSHDNLLVDQISPLKTPRLKTACKGMSTSELLVPQKEIDDKAIQCNGSVRFTTSPIKSESGKPRLIKSRNGMVSAFSDVPVLETSAFSNHTRSRSQDSYLGDEQTKGEVIYSQVDLSKKKRDRLNHSADGYGYRTPARSYKFGSTPALHELEVSSNASSSRDTRVRTTKKGFGLKLGSVFGSRRSDDSRMSPTYRRGGGESHDDQDSSDASLIPEAVVRDYDHKNKVINYENVPHQKPRDITSREGGLWFNASDEDYRRGMAQDDVSCIGAAQVVGTDPSYATMSRLEKAKKEDTPLTVTSYTLDRKHLRRGNNKLSPPPPTLMLNGHRLPSDIDERRSRTTSAASDTSSARGGLAAAYQARQRAVTRHRSSSRSTPPSSSDSESARRNHRRRTLVMYIPGVGHEARSADEDDRSSGITVARSQSILSSRPPRARPRRANASPELRRRHSIPKNAKFPWFKWRIKAKPSREP